MSTTKDEAEVAFLGLCDLVDRWRRWHRLSIKQLATATGVPVRQVSNICRGKYGNVPFGTLVAVCRVLGLNFEVRLQKRAPPPDTQEEQHDG
jgi:DNA-binding Xre family transcriptional regulator